ncbi:CBS domain-containing protein [Nonomuraea sp. SMC257]|uniref:CBS domain-containing protein n=1 Tax=Nonomuraea montanisoli TaxID=2741721 RepID=A0A7Y6ICT1_9ACTN|nr:CBS domain-containing protein [Nonomuraea montanisoli]NUW35706.1 CBS domain-containing protein [Nonomuraea montanisoli]
MLRINVRDVMTTHVASVEAGTPFKDVAELLVRREVSAVPVLAAGGRVVGVVSEADLLRKEEFREQYYGEGYRPRLRTRLRRRLTGHGADTRHKAVGVTAAELMSAPAVTVDPFASTVTAAQLMDAHGIKRLIVVDDDGRLIGIVSRRDLLKAYVHDDAEIKRWVEQAIPEQARWNDRTGIVVRVQDGIVTLSGHTATSADAAAAVHLAKGLGGVVGIREDFVRLGTDLRGGQARPGGGVARWPFAK